MLTFGRPSKIKLREVYDNDNKNICSLVDLLVTQRTCHEQHTCALTSIISPLHSHVVFFLQRFH